MGSGRPARRNCSRRCTPCRRRTRAGSGCAERPSPRSLPAAQQLARRYAAGRESLGDHEQVAAVGLIKAVDGFEPAHGVEFGAYATPTLTGELKRYFRDRTAAVRLPRRLQELRLQIIRARGELAVYLGRTPSTADLAAYLDADEADATEVVAAQHVQHAMSIDASVHTGGSDAEGDVTVAGTVAATTRASPCRSCGCPCPSCCSGCSTVPGVWSIDDTAVDPAREIRTGHGYPDTAVRKQLTWVVTRVAAVTVPVDGRGRQPVPSRSRPAFDGTSSTADCWDVSSANGRSLRRGSAARLATAAGPHAAGSGAEQLPQRRWWASTCMPALTRPPASGRGARSWPVSCLSSSPPDLPCYQRRVRLGSSPMWRR
ncbi:sigma factor [Dactylosporangium sp. CS-047395]|uniref:sigma factor n=1 Tax=Dactylosporangium sp. CS-047395 TaxID=3239936 RepID=UPI003D8F5268